MKKYDTEVSNHTQTGWCRVKFVQCKVHESSAYTGVRRYNLLSPDSTYTKPLYERIKRFEVKGIDTLSLIVRGRSQEQS